MATMNRQEAIEAAICEAVKLVRARQVMISNMRENRNQYVRKHGEVSASDWDAAFLKAFSISSQRSPELGEREDAEQMLAEIRSAPNRH